MTLGTAGTRTAVVASAAVLTLVTFTSMAGAHSGDDSATSIHACVGNSGALQILSGPHQSCRPNETPLHWTVTDGSAAELDAFKAELAAAGTGRLVHWSNLDGVPAALTDGEIDFAELTGSVALEAGSVTGSTVADESLTSADLAEGSVWSADIRNGSVLNEDLGPGAVTGATIADGSVASADLAGSYGFPGAPGAVTSEKILDGTVESRDLAGGSITPDKLRPQVASALSSGATTLATPQQMPTLAAVTAAPGSAVLLTGQVQITCEACTAVTRVEYQILRDGVAVGPAYAVDLSADHAADVASISVMDVVGSGGPPSYTIGLSAPGGNGAQIAVSNAALVVQVLGVP